MKYLFYCLICFVVFFSGGCKKEYPFYNGMGKKPIYMPKELLNDIKNLPPQAVQNTGTIFLLDTLFFMLEQKKGIHVFSLSNNANPLNLTFFNIPAINDFTINGNIIYADSWTDLLTIDIANLYAIKLLKREQNVFTPILSPPLYTGAFECANVSKGAIVEWVDAEIINARCEIFN